MSQIINKKIEYLKEFISKSRWELFQQKIENRTKYVTIVLEDIFQPHNISASIRSADCFGIQDVHIIENHNTFIDNNEVSMGSSKWIDIKKYNAKKYNTRNTINHLKRNGYQIIIATPHNSDISLFDPNILDSKTALVFGSEINGCSNQALELSDQKMKIPMYGFTESFNISVAVALCLQHLTYKIRESDIKWKMSNYEKKEVLLRWLRNSIKLSNNIEKEYDNNMLKDN